MAWARRWTVTKGIWVCSRHKLVVNVQVGDVESKDTGRRWWCRSIVCSLCPRRLQPGQGQSRAESE